MTDRPTFERIVADAERASWEPDGPDSIAAAILADPRLRDLLAGALLAAWEQLDWPMPNNSNHGRVADAILRSLGATDDL